VNTADDQVVDIIKVKDLMPGDKVAYGALLGSVTAADILTVKSVEPALKGHYAVTFHRVGTLFLMGEATVELLPED
jgi:hypothetical protein